MSLSEGSPKKTIDVEAKTRPYEESRRNEGTHVSLDAAGRTFEHKVLLAAKLPGFMWTSLRRLLNRQSLRNANRCLLEEARLKTLMIQNPLVTVRIATYQNSNTLVERTLPSVLNQTYRNLEVIIVGDGCTSDHTNRIESWIRDKGDSRIRFMNLPKRGEYPTEPIHRWLVAGVVPANKGIELAKGEWIAPLDDDDEFTPSHIEDLLIFAQKGGYEFVYGIAEIEQRQGEWGTLGSEPVRSGQICHLSVMYHKRLFFLKYDINAWKYGEAADGLMWCRMRDAGARIGFLPKIVGRHYRERTRMQVQLPAPI